MVVLVSLVIGLIAWIVLWAFGAKPLDSFLITIVLVIGAATFRIIDPYLKKLLKP